MSIETLTRNLETCGKKEVIETKVETDEVVHVQETETEAGLVRDRAIGGLDRVRDLGKDGEEIETGHRDGIGTGIETETGTGTGTGTGTEIGTENQVDEIVIGTEIDGIEHLTVMRRPLAMFHRTIR